MSFIGKALKGVIGKGSGVDVLPERRGFSTRDIDQFKKRTSLLSAENLFTGAAPVEKDFFGSESILSPGAGSEQVSLLTGEADRRVAEIRQRKARPGRKQTLNNLLVR